MGAPSSGIFSKIFLQCIGTSHFARLTKLHDHQLLLFKLTFFLSSTLHTQTYNPFLQILTPYTLTYTSPQKLEHVIQAVVYRKLTFTDTIIPYTSNHPFQHKYASITYLHNILHTCQLHNEEYNPEINFTHNIIYKNSFPINH